MAQSNFEERIDTYEIESTNVMTGDRDRSRYLYYQLKRSMAKAKQIDIIVSFLMESGVRMLLNDMKRALDRGVKIRILTGNYLGITQPSALYLIKSELGDRVDLRLYNETSRSFHPKSYIFHYESSNEIYIGSSNISKSALTSGIEWNYRFSDTLDKKNYELFYATFEDLFLNHSILIDDEELKRYSKAWKKPAVSRDLAKYDATEDGEDRNAENVRMLYRPRGAQMENVVLKDGFFAETFPVNKAESAKIRTKKLPLEVGEVSETFQCAFENSGIMKNGIIYTIKTVPDYHGKQITLGDKVLLKQYETYERLKYKSEQFVCSLCEVANFQSDMNIFLSEKNFDMFYQKLIEYMEQDLPKIQQKVISDIFLNYSTKELSRELAIKMYFEQYSRALNNVNYALLTNEFIGPIEHAIEQIDSIHNELQMERLLIEEQKSCYTDIQLLKFVDGISRVIYPAIADLRHPWRWDIGKNNKILCRK